MSLYHDIIFVCERDSPRKLFGSQVCSVNTEQDVAKQVFHPFTVPKSLVAEGSHFSIPNWFTVKSAIKSSPGVDTQVVGKTSHPL